MPIDPVPLGLVCRSCATGKVLGLAADRDAAMGRRVIRSNDGHLCPSDLFWSPIRTRGPFCRDGTDCPGERARRGRVIAERRIQIGTEKTGFASVPDGHARNLEGLLAQRYLYATESGPFNQIGTEP